MQIGKLTKYLALLILAGIMVITAVPCAVQASPAAVVDFALLPASQTVKPGNTFPVTIQAQCNGQELIGVDVFLDFDPSLLEVQSVSPGDTLNFPLQNTFDNSPGTVGYSAGKMSPPFPSATFTIATVTFKAKPVNGNIAANIGFNLSFPRTTNAVYGDTSILRQLKGTQVVIQGGAPSSPTLTPPPAQPAVTTTTAPATTTPPGTSSPSTTPAVTTGDVIFITTSEVILKGALTSLGNASQVSVLFEWGNDTGYGRVTPIQALTSPGEFSYKITGLTAMTEYHYRVKAVGNTMAYSPDSKFTTPLMIFDNSPGVNSTPSVSAISPTKTLPTTLSAPTGSSSPAGNPLTPSLSQSPSPKPSSHSWLIWLAAGMVVVAGVITLVLLSKRSGPRK